MNLLELERRMAEDVMRPLTSDFQMQPTTSDGRSTHELVSGYIRPNDRLDSFERLEIYNRQYWFRIINSFYEDFTALHALLGEERFYPMTIAYLETHPSRSFTLRNLGDRLESFLKKE